MKSKLSKRIIQASLLGLSASQASLANGNGNGNGNGSLANDNANIDLTVALYATISGLDDFTMSNTTGSNYAGSDQFTLNSNGQVRVTATTTTLGGTNVTPDLSLDNSGSTLDTANNSVHSATHSLEASTDLSGNNSLAAGDYSGVVTLTVSAI